MILISFHSYMDVCVAGLCLRRVLTRVTREGRKTERDDSDFGSLFWVGRTKTTTSLCGLNDARGVINRTAPLRREQ